MKIKSLKCNNCSADLQIDPKIKYFNCNFCGSSLMIKASGNVMYTEVLEDIKGNTETLLENSEIIVIEKAIARLDRDWEMEREQYKIQTKKGEYYPSEGGTNYIGMLIFLVFLGGFATISCNFLSSHSLTDSTDRAIPLVFCSVMAIFVIITFVSNGESATEYMKAKKNYEQKREELLRQLEEKSA